MKSKLFLAILSIATVLALGTSVASASSAEAKQQIDGLRKQLTEVEGQITALAPVLSSLLEERSRLESTKELLDGAAARYEERVAVHNRKVEQSTAETENLRGRCSGTFEDAGYVASCNAEIARKNAANAQLNAENETHRQMKQGLEERYESLGQAGDAWQTKANEYDATALALGMRKQALLTRINEALEDLKRRERMSAECPHKKTHEEASHCLQQIWDGAR